MGKSVESEIELRGAAEVILILDSPLNPASQGSRTELPDQVRSAFLGYNPFSNEVLPAAGAASPTSFFPSLGVAVGYVDRNGFSKILSLGEDYSIHLAEELEMILGTDPKPIADLNEGNWGIQALSIPRIWNAGIDGAQVRVCHLDTGVDRQHQLLSGRVVAAVAISAEGTVLGGGTVHAFRLRRSSTTKATDHELQKYDIFTRYGHGPSPIYVQIVRPKNMTIAVGEYDSAGKLKLGLQFDPNTGPVRNSRQQLWYEWVSHESSNRCLIKEV